MPSLPNELDVANDNEWQQAFEWRQVEYDNLLLNELLPFFSSNSSIHI